MFYKDYKYIGARRPYDYPEDIHFKRKYHLDNKNELNTSVCAQVTDFSELAYAVNDSSVDYNMGSVESSGVSSKTKIALIGVVVLSAYFLLMKKSK